MNDRTWRKSSYSSGQGNCVEVCLSEPGAVAVRDSKDQAGPELAVSGQAWSAFVLGVKQGEFRLG
jgi:Domain of unknown function (DUF397)